MIAVVILTFLLLSFTGIEKLHDIRPTWRWKTCYNTPHSEMTSKLNTSGEKRFLIGLTKIDVQKSLI